VTIVTASITSEIVVLSIFAIIRTVWPSVTPDVGALIRGGPAYLRDNYQQFAIWGIGMLAASVALAYVATIPTVRRGLAKVHLTGPYPHSSAVSAWWTLFEHFADGRQVHVGCILDDGSYLGGNLVSFNTAADDVPERELVLGAPIIYRQPSGQQEQEYRASGASVAARRIVALFVTYVVEQVTASSQAGEEAEEEGGRRPRWQGHLRWLLALPYPLPLLHRTHQPLSPLRLWAFPTDHPALLIPLPHVERRSHQYPLTSVATEPSRQPDQSLVRGLCV
jgi:Family of unknown function (DUF6338)